MIEGEPRSVGREAKLSFSALVTQATRTSSSHRKPYMQEQSPVIFGKNSLNSSKGSSLWFRDWVGWSRTREAWTHPVRPVNTWRTEATWVQALWRWFVRWCMNVSDGWRCPPKRSKFIPPPLEREAWGGHIEPVLLSAFKSHLKRLGVDSKCEPCPESDEDTRVLSPTSTSAGSPRHVSLKHP